MGVARLLAKGWVVFCLFAGGYALTGVGAAPGTTTSLPQILLIVALFGAMGLLFIAGYGVSSGQGGPILARLRPHHIIPGFNELVFIGFAIASFMVQTIYLTHTVHGGVLGALQSAIAFAVPGQGRLFFALGSCGLDGGRMFASSLAWLLAFIFLGSSLSRIRLIAGIVRLERKTRPETLGPGMVALLLGFVTIAGIQLFYIGSLYPLLPCAVARGIVGEVLIGLAPLMLSYLIVAALANLLALGPEA
jgi:hypothetical protein